MPSAARFRAWVPVTPGQDQPLQGASVPIDEPALDGSGLYSTFSVFQVHNQQSRLVRPSPQVVHPSRGGLFISQATQRPIPEMDPAFKRVYKCFREGYDYNFPDTPCAECGLLLLPRDVAWVIFDPDHEYGISEVLSVPIVPEDRGGDYYIPLCKPCKGSPGRPIDVGILPQCLLSLHQRSAKFLAPLTLQTSLGRTQSYNRSRNPYNVYRTLTGRMNITRNPRAIALYTGAIGAYLESNRDNPVESGHDREKLQECRDWLLRHNPIFRRYNVRTELQISAMPLVGLHDEDGAEHRPPYRPDLVLNPLPYDVDTRREDYRHYRLPIGVVQGAMLDRPETRSILRSDPSVELLLFPHLYPYGHGQWIRSPDEIRVRRENTRGQDLKRKLNSIISRFRDDWYWPAYAYMEVEATRIFQHNCRIVSGRTRQALDRRMPNPELLQQSAYGPWSVINEKLTTTMPGFIRTGESYFLENERKIKAMLDTYNIPTLFVTITFNERWEPYTRILAHGRQDAGIPSDRPWEAVQYYYERLYWLKKRFLRNPELSRYGALKEIVQRQEFQLRGAIHSHCLLWCGKSTRDLIEQSYVRADLPDPEAEPLLHSLVQKYQIHTCRDDICGGPQAPTGQCRKGFPAPLAAATSQVTGQLRYTYQRLTEADRYVVPYNAELLLFWDGHCNVQYCTSTGLAKYISKYVTKSEPNSLVNVHSQDHVTSHILARRMGSMEVMVMALGHPIFQMSSGSMYLPTALPGMRNSTVRPPWEVEDDPENPYYHDAIEKYFARPQVNDIIESTYFLYYTNYQVSKKRIRNTSGWRNGWQDSNGYWIYKRAKPILIRSNYRRLCDGDAFFFVKLLQLHPWRSDEEIKGDCETYRDRLFSLNPDIYQDILANQEQSAATARLTVADVYLELVQAVCEAVPQRVQEIVHTQLMQLNAMSIPGIVDDAALHLEGDQYRAYTTITSTISTARITGQLFFVTGPGGTGKSFLLKALEAWCNRSRNQALLLAPTGIAANSISGATIHSALALFSEGTSYRSGVLATGHDRRAALRRVKVLIIDEISMVDSQLLEFVSATFSKIHNNAKPFGNLHVVVLGDLMQLPPVTGYKVFYSPLWRLFHPLFLEQPQRQVRDLRFFRILNKIRFGLIDEEVQEALTERFQQYNPAEQTYKTTFLCSLRTEAYAMNEVVLASLPTSEPTSFPYVSVARDYEGDTPITNSFHSTTFKRGTNFPDLVTCIVGAKVMFLTNGMIHKGISNGTCGVITEVLHNGEVEVAFPTKDGIQYLHVTKTTSYFNSNGIDYHRTQLPLQNAFALTIHKVQGLSLPMVSLSLNQNIFSAGQAYTAISRAHRLEDVNIASLDWSAFQVDQEAVKEYERLRAIPVL